MKIKYVFNIVYLLIIIVVPCLIVLGSYKSSSINITNSVNSLNSEKIGVNSNNSDSISISENTNQDLASAESINETENNIEFRQTTDSLIPSINVASATYSDVLETLVGKLTAYGPDCPGCSGRVGWGQNVTGGNIYYNDANYGQLRIVAGDKKFPYGTVVRIKNSRAGSDIMAIVLDRGGSVGIGKATMFDLLFASGSEASRFGTSANCTFEILRYGF